MLHTLLGEEGFRKGCDLYFQRHDGQAVTTEDFVAALEDANDTRFDQFKRWYSQAGTPVISVSEQYDIEAKTYSLTFKQRCPATPNQATKEAFHIPIAIALIDQQGRELRLQGDQTTAVLELTEPVQTFVFKGINNEPTPSVLRGFSAPVRLEFDLSLEQKIHLFNHDSDSFNRWEAGQNCLTDIIFNTVSAIQKNQTPQPVPTALVDAFRCILQTPLSDLAYQTLLLSLPSKAYLIEQMTVVDIDALYQAHDFVKHALARSLKDLWLTGYKLNHQSGAGISPNNIAQRAYKNLGLDYLMALAEDDITSLCSQQFHTAENMTDQIAALGLLSHLSDEQSSPFFDAFYQQWKSEDLVIDKWFTLQACSEKESALENVKKLLTHPDFDIATPNRVRSLISAFAMANPLHFNAADGSGYQFIANNIIKLDSINPQVAARLANSLSRWRKFDGQRQQLIKKQLKRIQSHQPLSKDVLEIVTRSLSA